MRSDLASMAASGGGAPKFQSVAVSGLSIEKEYKNEAAAAVAATRKNFLPMLIVGVVAIIAIGGVGYFAYALLFSGSSSKTPTSTPTSNTLPSPTAPVTTQTQTSNTPPPNTELSSPHSSLFTKPADQIVVVDLLSTGYQQTMLSALGAASAASTMIEINPKAPDGSNLSLNGLLLDAGASLFNSQTLADLAPDATLFVYRDKSGLWPGYVIAPAAGESSSSLASSIQQQIEASSNSIGKLFLNTVGAPSSGGFIGNTLAGVTVRTLSFAGSYVPVVFVYGWVGNDLVLSTSQNGFAAVVSAL
jgi:hypothetical protein